MAKEVLEMEVKSNIGEVAKDTEKLTTASGKAQKGVGGIGKAFKGMGTAIKAAGIGLVVALLAKLMEVFSKNQKVLDFFNTAMTALSIAFNDLFKYLDDNYAVIKGYLKGIFTDPLGEMAKLGLGIEKFFIDKMKGAALVLKGVATIMANIANPKKMLEGMAQIAAGTVIAGKEIAAIYTDIEGAVSGYVSSVTDQAQGITALTNAALLAEVQFAKLNAENLRDAEIQRQIRDDVSKTFAVRIAANEELSKILTKQSADQKEQIQIQIDSAQAAVNMNNSIENRLALGQAENAMLELKETITGQISEQLTNQTGLEEELRQGREQSLAEGTSGLERELEELRLAYEEKKRLAVKSGVDTTAITKQYNKEQSLLVQENMNAQLEAFSGLAGALSALAGDNKALAVASAVIDTYVGANKAFAQGGTLGFVTGAAVIAAGLNNVRTIMATDVPDSGGGGGSVAAPSTPAPQMMSGAFDISGGVAPEPLQAYVLTDEMTNSQNQLANIRRRATI
jgi:hypothetical protein